MHEKAAVLLLSKLCAAQTNELIQRFNYNTTPVMISTPVKIRLATIQDAFPIMQLYQEVYQGLYSDPTMNRFPALKSYIETPGNFWFVGEVDGTLMASVLVRYDSTNLLAKAYGAVVKDEYRRGGVMENLLASAMEYVQKNTEGVDVMYATTRTVHEAAQSLTERLGFKKLGIFPNSHKTTDFETHCLVAEFRGEALKKRNVDYKLHYRLKGLVDLVAEEIPSLEKFEYVQPEPPSRVFTPPPSLEMIESSNFVHYRYKQLKQDHKLQFTFFPFHEPNVMILSPDQSVEIFCYHSQADGYSVITGGKVPDDIHYTQLFNSVANLLREKGARYVEALIRTDKPKVIDSILKAKFIPSAFFPAFQLSQGKRHDYVVMSKTFEIFDFQNIKLKGLNQKYLQEYFNLWKQTSLNPKLLDSFHTPTFTDLTVNTVTPTKPDSSIIFS